MVGWIALACLAGGIVCFFAAADSYNDDEWMAGGVLLVIVAIVTGVWWGVSDSTPKAANASSTPASQTEYSDAHWAKVNYDKFVAKYKLTAEQFPRINGESKAQVQARIRNFIETHKLKPGQGMMGSLATPAVVVEATPERLEERSTTSLDLGDDDESPLKFKSNW